MDCWVFIACRALYHEGFPVSPVLPFSEPTPLTVQHHIPKSLKSQAHLFPLQGHKQQGTGAHRERLLLWQGAWGLGQDRQKVRGGFALFPLGTAPAVPGTALAEDGAELCSVCPHSQDLLVLHGVNTALRLPSCNSHHLLCSCSSCPAVGLFLGEAGSSISPWSIGTAGNCCLHTAGAEHGRLGRARGQRNILHTAAAARPTAAARAVFSHGSFTFPQCWG